MTDITVQPLADIPTTLEGVQARQAELQPVIAAFLARGDDLTETEHAEYVARGAEWSALDSLQVSLDEAHTAELARREDLGESLTRFASAPGSVQQPSTATRTQGPIDRKRNPFDRDEINRSDSPSDLMARAMSAAEVTPDSSDLRRSGLTDLLERHGDQPMAELVLRTCSPEYKAAFAALVRTGEIGSLSDDQRSAIQFAERSAQQVRAMSTADAGGGYLIPTDIEPQITLTASGSQNPIYDIARRVPTTGTTLRNVGSPNAAWSWDAQNAEVSDDSVTLTNTDITLYSANGFIPVSFEAAASVPSIMSEMSRVLNGGYNDLVGAALATGTGSGQPFGINAALAGVTNEVNNATTTVLVVADLYTVWDQLATRHRRNAQWMMNNAQISRIRQFATDDGASLWVRLGEGSGAELMGRPVHENSDMDAGLAAGDDIMVLGNWEHYVIAEGVGTMVDIIPHVFGSNGRPTGARGIFAKARLGADLVDNASFVQLTGVA